MRRFCIALALAFGGALLLPADQAEAHRAGHHVGKHHHNKKVSGKIRGHSVSLAGITPVLAAKTRQIVASCGSIVVGAVGRRPGRSNHPIGRAVDLTGNPKCIYAHLKGWPGGYSTDYAAAGHVHISYNPGGQEWGLRFVHGGSRTRAARVAKSSPRKAGVTRYAGRGAAHYAMQRVRFAPTKHAVH
jgi:hypothetical protein